MERTLEEQTAIAYLVAVGDLSIDKVDDMGIDYEAHVRSMSDGLGKFAISEVAEAAEDEIHAAMLLERAAAELLSTAEFLRDRTFSIRG